MLLRSICISLLMMMSFVNVYLCFWCWTVLIPLLDHVLVKEHLDKLQKPISSEKIAIILAFCEFINVANLCLNEYTFFQQLFAILNTAFISVLIANALQCMQNNSIYCKWLFRITIQKYFDYSTNTYPNTIDTIYTNFKRNIRVNYKIRQLESQRDNFRMHNLANLILNRLTQQQIIYSGIILLIFIHLGLISGIRYLLLILLFNYIRLGLEYISNYGLNGQSWQSPYELSTSLFKKSKIDEINNPILSYSLISCFILAHRPKSWNLIKENFKENSQLEGQIAQQQITQEIYTVSLPMTILLAIVLTI